MKHLGYALNDLFTIFADKGPVRVDISTLALKCPVARVRDKDNAVMPMRKQWCVMADIIRQTPNAGLGEEKYNSLGEQIAIISSSITQSETFNFYAIEKGSIKYIAANLDMIDEACQKYSRAISSGKLPHTTTIENMPTNEIPLALARFADQFKKIMKEAKVESPAPALQLEREAQGGGKGWRNGGLGSVLSRQ